MIQKLKYKLLTIGTLFALTFFMAAPAAVSAANIQDSVCSGANTLGVSEPKDPEQCKAIQGAGTGKANDLIAKIINIFSIIVGIVAVIMIIYGGFRYITSAGNQESVKTAKNIIIYALIGLVIVTLSQVVVKFVLKEASTDANTGQCIQIGPEKKNSVTGKPC